MSPLTTPAAEDHDGSYEAVARLAVGHLKNCTKSSSALGAHCEVHPRYIDAALTPLVQARKLVRVSVMRGGGSEYDYRYSATWVPAESDFALCVGAGSAAPYPTTSPVAPPKATPAPVVPPPATRPSNALPAASVSAPVASMSQQDARALFLGWADSLPHPTLDAATLDAVLDQSTVLSILEADDLVCALNSRGELAIDLGDGHLIKFPPPQALALKRFLGATTVLEDLHARQLI